MPPILNVFISSSMEELKAERELLYELLPTLSTPLYQVRAWVYEESIDASPRTIRETYLEGLRQSSLYIGMFARTYGEYTVDEFYQAARLGIDRHVYLRDTPEDTGSRQARLKEFLNQETGVTTGITTFWFKNLDTLGEKVMSAVQNWLSNRILSQTTHVDAALITDMEHLLDLPRRFFGQEALLTQGQQSLNQGDSVLLFGEGGVGKTAVASLLAARFLEQTSQPLIWLHVGNAEPQAALNALLNSVGNAPAAGSEQAVRALREAIKRANVGLVVVDGALVYETVYHITKALPTHTRLLVTSRLRFPSLRVLQVEPLPQADAIKLLGSAADQDFSADAGAAELVTHLAGNPYALLLAGSMMVRGQLSVAEMLRESVKQMQAGDSSMTALIEASLNPLYVSQTPEEKNAYSTFMAIGAFPGRTITPELLALYFFTRPHMDEEYVEKHFWFMSDAGKELMRDYGPSIENTEDRLFDQLGVKRYYADKLIRSLDTRSFRNALSLLERRGLLIHRLATATHAEHFEMNLMAFDYASAQVTHDQRRRALNACVTYVHSLRENADYPRLLPHLENFMKLLRWAANYQPPLYPDLTKALILGLIENRFLYYQGLNREAHELLQIALNQVTEAKDTQLEVNLLNELAIAAMQSGDLTQAESVLKRALQLTDDKNERQRILGHLAGIYLQSGENDLAIETYAQSSEIAREIQHPDEAAWEGNLGLAFQNKNHFKEAEEHHRRALELHRQFKNQLGEANELGNLASVLTHLGQYERALEMHQEALGLHRAVGYQRGEGKDIGNIGMSYMFLKQYQEAIEYLQGALKFAEEMEFHADAGDWLQSLGWIAHRRRQFSEAAQYYRAAANAYTRAGTHYRAQPLLELAARAEQGMPLAARNTIDIGLPGFTPIKLRTSRQELDEARTLMQQGKLEAALALAQPGLVTARVMDDWEREYDYLDLIGTIEFFRGKPAPSLQRHENALELAIEQDDGHRVGIQLSNSARAHMTLGNLDEARQRYESALEIARRMGDIHAVGVRLASLGQVYTQLKDYPNAEKYLREALEIARQERDLRTINNRLGNLGVVAYELKQFGEAETLLLEALNFAREASDMINVYNWLIKLAYIAFQRGDYEKGYGYALEAIQIATEHSNAQQMIEGHKTAGVLKRENAAYPDAQRHFQEALTVAETIGDAKQIEEIQVMIAFARTLEAGLDTQMQQGDAAVDAGDYAGALKIYQQVLEAAQTVHHEVAQILPMLRVMRTYALMGELDKAILYHEQVSAMRAQVGMPQMGSELEAELRRLLQQQRGAVVGDMELPPVNTPLHDLRSVSSSPIVGRTEVLQNVRSALDSDRRVMLVGDSGIGKTSLAQLIAGERERIFWFNAYGNDPDFLLAEFCLMAGQALDDPRPLAIELEAAGFVATRLARFAADALFVLDDVSDAAVLQKLLGVIPPTARTLVTGETPLDPAIRIIDIPHLEDEEETALIQDRAGLLAPRRAVSLIAERVGNIPLEADIAARLLRERGESYLTAQTAASIFDWAYESLTDTLKTRYRLLGILPSHGAALTLPMLAGLWGDDSQSQESADELDYAAKAFAGLGLLILREGLFYLHPRVAEDAAVRMTSDEREQGTVRLWDRLAAIAMHELSQPTEMWQTAQTYYASFHHAALQVLEHFKGILHESLVAPNISPTPTDAHSMLDEAFASSALRLLQSLAPLVTRFGHWRYLGLQLMQIGLVLARLRHDQWYEVFFLNRVGLWHSDVDETQAGAKNYFERALQLVGSVADKRLEADIRHNFGFACIYDGEPAQAVEHLQISLRLHRFFQDTDNQIATLGLLARIAGNDRIHEALGYVEQAMQLAEKTGNAYRQAGLFNELGLTYDSLRQTGAAIENLEKGVEITRRLHLTSREGVMLTNLSEIYMTQGEYALAATLAEKALEKHHLSGNHRMESHTLNVLGRLVKALGQPERAPAIYERAIQHAQAVDAKDLEASALNNLAGIFWDRGEYQQALDHYGRAYFLHVVEGSLPSRFLVMGNMATLCLQHLARPYDASTYLEFILIVAQARGASTRFGSINLQDIQFNLVRARRDCASALENKAEFERVKEAVQRVLQAGSYDEILERIASDRDILVTPLADILIEYYITGIEGWQNAIQNLRNLLDDARKT